MIYLTAIVEGECTMKHRPAVVITLVLVAMIVVSLPMTVLADVTSQSADFISYNSTFDVGEGLAYGVTFYDRMLERHLDDAIPYQESETFEVLYRVRDTSASVCPEFEWIDGDELPAYRNFDIEVLLRNKTPQTLSNLYIRLHGRLDAQYLSVLDSVLIDPHDMGPVGSHNKSGIGAGASTSIDLRDAALTGGLTTDTFYDVLIEVCWDEGEELLLVTSEDLEAIMASDDAWRNVEGFSANHIDQEEIDEMNDVAYAWFEQLYPEDYEKMKETNEPRPACELPARP